MPVTSQDWLQAQYSVLGAALIEPELVPKIIAETSERDFCGPGRTVYNAMRKVFLAGRPVDPVSIGAVVGPDYRALMVQMMDIVPSAANVDSYIQLCREQARVMSVRDIARKMAETESSDKLRSLLEEANSHMVDKPSLKITTMADALRSFMDRHTAQTNYLSWPIRELDGCIYAEPGDFIIMGGYPSAGKSALALQCAWHWARDHKVGFFSLETSDAKLFDRQMSAIANLAMDDIKRNSIDKAGWDRVCGMTSEILSHDLEIVPAAGMTPADIRSVTIMKGYQIIFIDYLQLLQGIGENRTAQVTSISIALHTLAQSLGVTVVALSQLARPDKQEKNPKLNHLRESGQIEQDADVVLLLSLVDEDNYAGLRNLFVAKNKEGTRAKMVLAFDGKHQTFSKAQQTGSTVSKYVAAGKKAKRRNKQASQSPDQLSMLPDDYPVPF